MTRTIQHFFVVSFFAWAVVLLPLLASAQTPGYEISFTDTTVNAGDPISVAWQAPATSTRSKDWIGLYKAGTSDRRFVAWKYIPDSGTSGTVSLSYSIPGSYEARLFTGDDYNKAATTITPVVVGPDVFEPVGEFEVALTARTYAPNDPVQVSFKTPAPRATARDWVGIYKVGTSDRSFVAWKYLPNGSNNGSLSFSIAAEGTYEARLFIDGGYTKVASSENKFIIDDEDGPTGGSYTLTVSPVSITTGAAATVRYQAASGVSRTKDWVGLYRVGESDRSYVSWKYIGSSASGTLSFTPPAAGTYEFRYFKNDSFTKVATSPRLTVSGGGGTQCTVVDVDDITNYPPENGPVVAFGDSLTAGVGASTDQDYVSQLERKAGITIINEGVSGDTTEEALSRLQSDVLARNPSVVIVWLGGNDIIGRFYERVEDGLEDISTIDWLKLVALKLTGKIPDTTGITEDETFANLTEIVERIQATGAITIIVGFKADIIEDNLENRFKQVANTTGSLYVPDVLDDITGHPTRMGDLVHPNNTGYGIVADRVLPYAQCVLPR